jgi:hypothetical protein
MRITRSMSLWLAVAALALALVSGGCATMAPKAEHYVAPPTGSTYTNTQTNTGSFGSGTSQITTKVTEQMWEGNRVTAFVTQAGTLLCTADGQWPALLGPGDKPIMSWDPPIGFEWPLEVGKIWTKSYQATIYASKQIIPFDSTWKVESYEDVTVPAGTFKAFKISYSDTIGNETVQWMSPELGIFVKRTENRTTKNPAGPGTRGSELISQNIKK